MSVFLLDELFVKEGVADKRSFFIPLEGATASPVQHVERLSGGKNNQYVHRLYHVNGAVTLAKGLSRQEDQSKEILASHVGEAIGAPIGESLATFPSGNAQFEVQSPFFEGRAGVKYKPSSNPLIQASPEVMRKGGKRLGLLDALISNTDRMHYNWIVPHDAPDEVRGIDHGNTFRGWEPPRSPFSQFWANPDVPHGNKFTEDELLPYEDKLKQLAHTFDAYGFNKAHEDLMDKYYRLLDTARPNGHPYSPLNF